MQNCRIAFNPLLAVMLSVFLLGSCGKDCDVSTDSNRKVSSEYQDRIKQIIDFTSAMSGSTTEFGGRGGGGKNEYTPKEFLNYMEESINYTYAIPFDQYWDVASKNDTIIVPINNCKILATEAPQKYDEVLNKIACQYNCININNKKLKFVKVSLIDSDCYKMKLSLLTVAGSIDLTTSIGEPDLPGPSELPTYKRKFTTSLWATFGTCFMPDDFGGISAPVELGEKATYNLIGGTDLAHTLINLQTIYADHLNMGWWSFTCREDGADPEHEACSDYFNPDGSYTQLGYDYYCLTSSELNGYLSTAEQNSLLLASLYSKNFVQLQAHADGLGIARFIKIRWPGLLTLGNKIYRLMPPILLPEPSSCGC